MVMNPSLPITSPLKGIITVTNVTMQLIMKIFFNAALCDSGHLLDFILFYFLHILDHCIEKEGKWHKII